MGRTAVVVAAALTLMACGTAPAVKVQTDHDPAKTSELHRYRTYRVLPAPTHGALQDVATGAAIVRSVDDTLGGKGYRQEVSRPDFFVKWHVNVDSRQRTSGSLDAPTFRDVRPMPSAGTSSAPTTATRQEREGTLTLDVVDAASNVVVWRGTAQAELTGSGDAAGRDARIQDAVRRILERFPPD
jgi:hypothetical protein